MLEPEVCRPAEKMEATQDKIEPVRLSWNPRGWTGTNVSLSIQAAILANGCIEKLGRFIREPRAVSHLCFPMSREKSECLGTKREDPDRKPQWPLQSAVKEYHSARFIPSRASFPKEGKAWPVKTGKPQIVKPYQMMK